MPGPMAVTGAPTFPPGTWCFQPHISLRRPVSSVTVRRLIEGGRAIRAGRQPSPRIPLSSITVLSEPVAGDTLSSVFCLYLYRSGSLCGSVYVAVTRR